MANKELEQIKKFRSMDHYDLAVLSQMMLRTLRECLEAWKHGWGVTDGHLIAKTIERAEKWQSEGGEINNKSRLEKTREDFKRYKQNGGK